VFFLVIRSHVVPADEPPKLTPLLEALIAEKTILKAKHGSESAKQSGAKESRGGKGIKGAQTSQASPAIDNVPNRPKAETEPHPKGKRPGKGKKDAAPTMENNHLRQKNASGHPGPKTGPHVAKNPAPKPPHISNGPQTGESKPPRREREKERKKAREATATPNAPAVTVLANPQAQNQKSTAAPPPAHSKKSEAPVNTSSTPAASGPAAAPAEPSRPRRGRPMLGLGSRQFAAALSHAGVSGSGKLPREKGSGGGQDSNAAT
jgi:regulator of nonsense transcripts 3